MEQVFRALTLIVFFLRIFSWGATYYVSPTGSNSGTGTEADPWGEIAYATCANTNNCLCTETNPNLIDAGDTLLLRGGVYHEHDIRFYNRGTADNPIVLKAYPGEEPIIDGDYSYPGVIVLDRTEHIIIDSITIRRGQKSGIMVGYDVSTPNIIIKNCHIYDIQVNDNTACIFVQPYYDGLLIQNNVLNMGYPETGRGAGVELFMGGNNAIIENNEIYNVHRAIYYKHGVNGGSNRPIIRNNYIYDIGNKGIVMMTDNAIIENNLLVDAHGIYIHTDIGSGCDRVGGFYTQITHNTIINGAIYLGDPAECTNRGARYSTVEYNLVQSDASEALLSIWQWGDADATGHNTTSHTNMYWGPSSNVLKLYGSRYTVSQFQSNFGMDNNSIYDQPVFVDALSGDYTLASGSPGKNMVNGTDDVGADMSLVGPSITVSGGNQPVITSNNYVSGTVGEAFSYQITTSPSASSFSSTALPSGLSLNSSTGLISGTPERADTETVSITATNGSGTSDPFSLEIRIEGAAVDVTSPTVTSVTIAPSISLYCGETGQIAWNADDDIGVDMLYFRISYDNGASYRTFDSLSSNPGTISFSVPPVPTHTARIQIYASDAAGNVGMGSSEVFTITDSTTPVVSLVRPDGGDTLIQGSNTHITWNAVDNLSVSACSLYYSIDNGSNWNALAYTSNSGLYSWNVTAAATQQGLVRVVAFDSTGNHGSDISASTFSIVTQDITSPQISNIQVGTTADLYIGGQYTISWEASDDMTVTTCSVFVKLTNVSEWEFVDEDNSAPYSVMFTAPQLTSEGTLFQIKAVDSDGKSGIGTSSLKTIKSVSASATVLSASETEINWNSGELSGTNISYFILAMSSDGIVTDVSDPVVDTLWHDLGTSSYTIENLQLNTTYYLSLFAATLTGEILSPDSTGQVVFSTNSGVSQGLIAYAGQFNNTESAGISIKDTIRFVGNLDSTTFSFLYAPAGEELAQGVFRTIPQNSDTFLIITSIPSYVVDQKNGVKACFTAKNGGGTTDTVNLSRQVLRSDSSIDEIELESNVWRPIYVSASPTNNSLGFALRSLHQQGETWHYNPDLYRVTRWQPSVQNNSNGWVEYSESIDSLFQIQPGQLIWMKAGSDATINFGEATTPPMSDPIEIVCSAGEWTDFANPFLFNIYIGDIFDASDAGADELELYRWDINGNNQYVTEPKFLSDMASINSLSDSLTYGSGNGYSVYNPTSSDITLRIPPVSTKASQRTLTKQLSRNAQWSVRVDLCDLSQKVLQKSYCGFSLGNGDSKFYKASPSFSKYGIKLKNEDTPQIAYGHAVKKSSSLENGAVFNYSFVNNDTEAQKFLITVGSAINLPADYHIYLLDPSTAVMEEVGDQGVVIEVGGGLKKERQIIVGTDAFIKSTHTTLKQFSSPSLFLNNNPIKNRLLVTYAVPVKPVNKIEFEVINMQGQLLNRIVLSDISHLATGFHVLDLSRGRDSQPRMQSGVYVVRMKTFYSQTNEKDLYQKKITFVN